MVGLHRRLACLFFFLTSVHLFVLSGRNLNVFLYITQHIEGEVHYCQSLSHLTWKGLGLSFNLELMVLSLLLLLMYSKLFESTMVNGPCVTI